MFSQPNFHYLFIDFFSKNYFFNYFLIGFLLGSNSAWSKTSSSALPEKKITATFVWSGDFSGAYDFSGVFDQLIKAEANQIESSKIGPIKNPENCEVSAHFSDVITRFSDKNEPAYKFYFVFKCIENQKPRITQTPPFFIRKDSLKGPNQRVHLSEKIRTTEFFVKEFSAKN